MVDVLQAVGLAYLAGMVYLSFVYYKQNNYSVRSFAFWLAVWAFGAVLILMPETASLATQRLNVPRVIDFYLILGIMFFSVICFLSWSKVKENERRIEDLVRKMALEKRK